MTTSTPIRRSRGYILLLALVFAGIFATVSTALVGFVLSYSRAERATVLSAQALAIAEGALNKSIARMNEDPSYTGEIGTPLGNGTFTIAVVIIDSSKKRVTATGYVPNSQDPVATKTIKADVGIDRSVVSFHYGVQAGMGGFTLDNSAKIAGNVFSGGHVIGSSQNYVYGDVVSSGPNGLVRGIHATSSVYAHTIGGAGEETIVDKNAYYATTKVNTTVYGTSYPNSIDQDVVPLPISDAKIAEWEAEAEAGGIATCTNGAYNITSGSVSLGPVKIPCDLTISNSSVVTIYGHIWVEGDIVVQNSAQVQMAPSLGANNVAIIADKPTDQINSSTITVANTATFQDSGTDGSFVFLISQNKSAEMGGEVPAFSLSNSASALVAYAAHGLIPLANTVSLKEVTAYKIHLQNSASVTYDTGLPSAIFQSGPGGSWTFIPGSYAITR
jgi:hypothetical protein